MSGRSLVLFTVHGPQVSLCGQQNGVTNATNSENKEAHRFATSIRAADPDLSPRTSLLINAPCQVLVTAHH